jgi:hypothetical protein
MFERIAEAKNVDTMIINRLVKMWDKGFKEIKKSWKMNPREKLVAEFGSWFASGKFNKKWAFENFVETLKLGVAPRADTFVLEQLAVDSEEMPCEASITLKMLIELQRENPNVFWYKDEIMTVLSNSLQSDNEKAIANAK